MSIKIMNFYYTLDVSYIQGVDRHAVKKEREAGRNVDTYYHPKPTAIYLSWSIGGKYCKIAIGHSIKPAEWDFISKLPLRKHQFYLELSVLLKAIKSNVEKEYLNMRTNGLIITQDSISKMVKEIIGGNHRVPHRELFWKAFDEFLLEKSHLCKAATIIKYRCLRNTLQKFEKAKYKLSFENTNVKLYSDFLIYSIETLKHLNNTTAKNVKNLKAFLAWCYEHPDKYNKSTDYLKFKAESDYTAPIFLTMQELSLIENYDTGTNHGLSISKDIFLFLCYTGQRISDITQLKVQHLKTSKDMSSIVWELYQQKGNKQRAVNIYLVQKAKKSLSKYLIGKEANDFVFPRQSSVVTNRNLKVMGKAARLDQLTIKNSYSGTTKIQVAKPKWQFLTTHLGRKTFVSLLSNSMSDVEIRSMTGHESSVAMRPYLGVDPQMVSQKLSKIFSEALN